MTADQDMEAGSSRLEGVNVSGAVVHAGQQHIPRGIRSVAMNAALGYSGF